MRCGCVRRPRTTKTKKMPYFDFNGQSLRYETLSAEGKRRGRVIMMVGFRDFIERYHDAMANFASMGLDVLCFDWLGQGLSSRLGSGSRVVHVDDFSVHLRSAWALADSVGFFGDDEPLFLFGHSMGGHLALRFGRDLHELMGVKASGVMVISPMLMPPHAWGLSPRLIVGLASAFCALGQGKRGVFFGQGGFHNPDFDEGNRLTRDAEGYSVYYRLTSETPALRTDIASFGWVRAAYSSCLSTTGSRSWMGGYGLSVQAHLPGDERVVEKSYFDLCRSALPRGECFDYGDARHELLLERPEVRSKLWSNLRRFVGR